MKETNSGEINQFRRVKQPQNIEKNIEPLENRKKSFQECLEKNSPPIEIAKTYHQYLESQYNCGNVSIDINEFFDNEPYLKNYYSDSIILARHYLAIGIFFLNQGKLEISKAIRCLQEAEIIFRLKNNYKNLINTLLRIHDCQEYIGVPDHIQFGMIEKTEQICKQHGTPIDVATILIRKFNILRNMNENTKAMDCFKDFEKITHLHDISTQVVMWCNYADFIKNIYNSTESLIFLKKKYEIIKKESFHEYILCMFYAVLSDSYSVKEQYKKNDYIERALSINLEKGSQSIENKKNLGLIYAIKARCKADCGEMLEAIKIFKRAEIHYRDNHHYSASITEDFIHLYGAWYRHTKDEKILKKMTVLKQELDEQRLYGKADYSFRNGDYEKTLQFLDELLGKHCDGNLLKQNEIKADLLEKEILCYAYLASDNTQLIKKGLTACDKFEQILRENNEKLSIYQLNRLELERLFFKDYSIVLEYNKKNISLLKTLFEEYKNILKYFKNDTFICMKIYSRMRIISQLLDDDAIQRNIKRDYDFISLAKTVHARSTLPKLLYDEAEVLLKNNYKKRALTCVKEAISIIEQIRETIISLPFRSQFAIGWKKLFDLGVSLLVDRNEYKQAIDIYERSCSRRLLDEIANSTKIQQTIFPQTKIFDRLKKIQSEQIDSFYQVQNQNHIRTNKINLNEINSTLRKCEKFEKISDVLWEKMYSENPEYFYIKQAPVIPLDKLLQYIKNIIKAHDQVLLLRYAQFRNQMGLFVIDLAADSNNQTIEYISLDYQSIQQEVSILNSFIDRFQNLFEESNEIPEKLAKIAEGENLKYKMDESQEKLDSLKTELAILEVSSEIEKKNLENSFSELQNKYNIYRVRFNEILDELNVNQYDSLKKIEITLEKEYESIPAKISEMENSSEIQLTLAKLYDLLWRPVEPFIKKNVHDIYLFPSNIIASMPFYALYNKKENICLIDKKFAININYSLNLLPYVFYRRKSTINGKALLIAPSPELNETSDEEFEAFRRLSPKKFQILEGNNSNLETIRKGLPTASWLHFTAHGNLDRNDPLSSYIEIGNSESLSIWEIYKSAQLTKNILTNLSSCFSATSVTDRHNEILSMVRGFLFAGSPCVIGTLWAIETKKTNTMMKFFYNLLQESVKNYEKNINISHTLKSSMRLTRKKHPFFYYWAAFQIYGDTDGIGNKSKLPSFDDFQMKIDYAEASRIIKEYENAGQQTPKGSYIKYNTILDELSVVNEDYQIDEKIEVGKTHHIKETNEIVKFEKNGEAISCNILPRLRLIAEKYNVSVFHDNLMHDFQIKYNGKVVARLNNEKKFHEIIDNKIQIILDPVSQEIQIKGPVERPVPESLIETPSIKKATSVINFFYSLFFITFILIGCIVIFSGDRIVKSKPSTDQNKPNISNKFPKKLYTSPYGLSLVQETKTNFIIMDGLKIIGGISYKNPRFESSKGELFYLDSSNIKISIPKEVGKTSTDLHIKNRSGEILITDKTGEVLGMIHQLNPEFIGPNGEKIILEGKTIKWYN